MRSNNIIDFLKRHEPELKNPEKLTKGILSAINKEEDGRKNRFIIIQRILVAASICLLLVFGIEQYIFVDKILQLENNASKISTNPAYIKGFNMFIKNTDFNKLMQSNVISNIKMNDKSFFESGFVYARLSSINIEDARMKDIAQFTNIILSDSPELINSLINNYQEK